MNDKINGIIVNGKGYVVNDNPSNECRYCDFNGVGSECNAPWWIKCYNEEEFCSYDFNFSQELTDKLNKQ